MTRTTVEKHAGIDSPVHRLDARVKIVSLLALVVVCVGTPRGAYGAFAAYFALLMLVAAIARVPAPYILRRPLAIMPFAAMTAVFLPFMERHGGTEVSGLAMFGGAMGKAYLGAMCVILLSATTPFAEILRGLERLWIPRIFTMTAGFAYRYLFVLRDEAARMKRAGDSRGYGGRWLWQAGTIGNMAASLFLRGYERGERVYLAMISRGFIGVENAYGPARLQKGDYLFVLGCAAWMAVARGLA